MFYKLGKLTATQRLGLLGVPPAIAGSMMSYKLEDLDPKDAPMLYPAVASIPAGLIGGFMGSGIGYMIGQKFGKPWQGANIGALGGTALSSFNSGREIGQYRAEKDKENAVQKRKTA